LGGFLLDGAHNPHAIEVLRAEWQGRYGEARTTIVLGALADKDVAGLIAGLRTIASRFILAPVNSDRGAATADLAQAVREVLPGVAVEESADVKEAMARAKAAKSSNLGIPVLVTGSLFLVGEALEALGWPADKGLSP
jgi:dihydrofolate synthase/folylpolyglutamate synthase